MHQRWPNFKQSLYQSIFFLENNTFVSLFYFHMNSLNDDSKTELRVHQHYVKKFPIQVGLCYGNKAILLPVSLNFLSVQGKKSR
jgi:hypothetical protein